MSESVPDQLQQLAVSDEPAGQSGADTAAASPEQPASGDAQLQPAAAGNDAADGDDAMTSAAPSVEAPGVTSGVPSAAAGSPSAATGTDALLTGEDTIKRENDVESGSAVICGPSAGPGPLAARSPLPPERAASADQEEPPSSSVRRPGGDAGAATDAELKAEPERTEPEAVTEPVSQIAAPSPKGGVAADLERGLESGLESGLAEGLGTGLDAATTVEEAMERLMEAGETEATRPAAAQQKVSRCTSPACEGRFLVGRRRFETFSMPLVCDTYVGPPRFQAIFVYYCRVFRNR